MEVTLIGSGAHLLDMQGRLPTIPWLAHVERVVGLDIFLAMLHPDTA